MQRREINCREAERHISRVKFDHIEDHLSITARYDDGGALKL